MPFRLVTAILAYFLVHMAAASDDVGFIYQGFQSSNLSLDGLAKITNNGLLQITNTIRLQTGHAFYPNPINFKSTSNSSSSGYSNQAQTFSFSTQFVFAMVPDVPGISGAGMAFVIAPTRDLPGGPSTKFLGLFNESTNGNRTNHNSFDNLNLSSGKRMQVWVEYDGVDRRIDVTLAPIAAAKPNTPLLSLSCDLSPILQQTMYVGFSASTSPIDIGIAYFVLGWSFKMNGDVQPLDLSRLPQLPRRKWKFAEVLEEWELAYGPHRFKYKDIYIATKGFTEKQPLGEGGFGQVYKGVLQTNMAEVAVKKVSHQARQGMREFIAEILLLVYEFMPNGSLDKFLYNQPKYILSWSQRFRVIKSVALGLHYLHEEWEQVVIHRDVKASNVLLDGELNGRLGDFGLARLYDHGTLPQSTHVAGSLGYLAPEHNRTGMATMSTEQNPERI
ncbi:unnamed protein product [Coffea canephora]|uniref:DH200=94 genomic scaffold, scaffold_151 n=1 Tax=Coffea canephora TaxID=49390 RepID=A0A068VC80_COFCA|nr:unnamed protein product [Coffea canephora]